MAVEFEQMNEAYRDKHFPKGSVYEKSAEKNKSNSIILIVMLVLLAAAMAWGCFFFLDLGLYYRETGDSSYFTVSMVIIGVLVLLILLCVLGIVKLAKSSGKGAEAAVQRSAKVSKLTPEEIREFDRQAMQSDTRVLRLKGTIAAAFTNQSDGLLTRDYLWLGDFQNCVMKRADLAGACLYEWTYYAGRKRMRCLSVAVISRQNQMISAEADSQRGYALLDLLKTLHPSLQMPNVILREGKEFDNWRKSVAGV